MKNNDTLKNLLVAGSIFMLIMVVIPKFMPPPPVQDQSVQPVQPLVTGEDSVSGNFAPIDSPSNTLPSTAGATGTVNGYAIKGADEAKIISMGAAIEDGLDRKNPGPYRMRLRFSNLGASIHSATLTDHAEFLHSRERYQLLAPIERPDGTTYRSMVVYKINIDGVDLSLYNQPWQYSSVEPYSRPGKDGDVGRGERIYFGLNIEKDGQPLIKLTRAYELLQQPASEGKHDLVSIITIENLSKEPHQIVLSTRGGLGVRLANARGGGPFIDYGAFDGDGRFIGGRETFASVTQDQRVKLYKPALDDPNQRFGWAATANTYFSATIAPLDASGEDRPVYIAEVAAIDVDGDPLTTDDATISLVTRNETVQPGSTLTYPSDIFIGEKDVVAFKQVPTYLNRNYYFQITEGFGMCTFTWLVELMVWLLNSLFSLIPDYGLAIIVMVLIVRTLLHPITKKGQVNMVRMQKQMGEFTPKVEELKKKFGSDKARVQQETMKLYREHGINPAGQFLNCLPMVIQMPIWIALFLSLSNNIGMRHAPFHGTWIHDLTSPDALITFASPLPLIGEHFNLLPLLVSLFMYIQQKLQPKPAPNPNMSEQQRSQQDMMQKMMPMMSIMMLFIFYKMPSGLNLYIMFSSLFGAIEQYRIRKHIKEQEEAGTLIKPKKIKPDADSRKKPGQMSFFEKMQKMAADAQEKQAKSAKKSKKRK